jgi:hypothetical protein
LNRAYFAAGAEAGGVGVMAPPEVPEGEVEGEVIGAVEPGVLVSAGLGPQPPSATSADTAKEIEARDLSEVSNMKIPFFSL